MHPSLRSVPWLVVALVVVAGFGPAGCSRRPAYVAEPDKAAVVLETVLAAWRDGVTCEDLRKRVPPIHVADERWLRGATLESFSIGQVRPFGPSTRFEVTLVGPAPLGTKQVVYHVSTQPALSVALED